MDAALDTGHRLVEALSRVIRGQRDTIKLVVCALLADGHALLEDYPGSGKTTLAKTLGRLIAVDRTSTFLPFRRIQFTPDMLPGDVLGVNVFEPQSGKFNFISGPVFAHIVLADEINRAGPKVQAAFLESMAEKQITIDNVTHRLDPLFFVLGTQNPLDMAGTYPLPLVQLDRFLMKIPMRYVDAATEVTILEDHARIRDAMENISPVCRREEILQARLAVEKIIIQPHLREAIVNLVQETRRSPLLQFGASTRAALMLQSAIRAWALINGRSFATEDDLKAVCPYVLLHRMRFHPGAGSPMEALNQIVAPVMERLIRATR